MSVLKVENICINFGGVKGADNVSFEVASENMKCIKFLLFSLLYCGLTILLKKKNVCFAWLYVCVWHFRKIIIKLEIFYFIFQA